MQTAKAIELVNVNKKFDNNTVINNISFDINQGEMVSIVGTSGKGKTTLLNMMGLISKTSSGSIKILGKEICGINSKKAMLLRRKVIGYLFQNYGLVDDESVAWNLKLALSYKKLSKKEKDKKINDILEKFNMSALKSKKIYQLSGGEQQRVAIMRLILQDCDIILADEPTGSLDSQNRDKVISYLRELNNLGKTVVIVTHDMVVANECDRIISI
nr:putative bacteriocin export ABC transporter [uncultured Ruminococcus sp.]